MIVDYGYEDRLLSLIDLRAVIAKRLSPRQKSVLRARFKMGETHAEIAKREGLSSARIQQICSKALRRLRRVLETPIERQITASAFDKVEFLDHMRTRAEETERRHQIAAERELAVEKAERLRKWIYRIPPPPLETKALSLLELIRTATDDRSPSDEERVIDISAFLPGGAVHPYRSIVRHHQWFEFRFDDGSVCQVPPGLYLVPSSVLFTHRHRPPGSLDVIDHFHDLVRYGG